MDKWTEQLSTGLAARTSRRGVIGRTGRALAVVGAAVAGGAKLEAVYATHTTCHSCDTACWEFGVCGCTDGVGRSCGGTGIGGCTGSDVRYGCTGCGTGGCAGWVWYCCAMQRLYRCRDCCDCNNKNIYWFTCAIDTGYSC